MRSPQELRASGTALQTETFHLGDWLEEAMQVISAGLGKEDINVVFDVSGPLPTHLVGDARALHKALLCLLENATTCSLHGAVVCRVALAQPSACVRHVDFEVTDADSITAHGLPRSHVADRVQVQHSSARGVEAAGAGLTEAKRLVHLAGGSLQVQSRPGLGNRFFFSVPLPAPPMPAVDKAAPLHPAQPCPAVVDVGWICSRGTDAGPAVEPLRSRGISLQTFDSLDSWVAHAAIGTPGTSLLVVDLDTATSAPLQALVSRPVDSRRPMAWIVRSDHADESVMRACRRAGAVDWVPLAYARDHLPAVVERHFNAEGALRSDPNNPVVAINSHAAMVQSQCDAAFFASLLEAFLEELPQRLKSMQKAWPHNAAEFKHHGHSLKGVAAALGLQSLHLVASKAESFAGQAVHPKPIELMPHLEGEIQSARFQIMRWLALNPP